MDLSNDGSPIKKRRIACMSKMSASFKKSVSSIEMWRSASAEFVATFILIFIISISSINLSVEENSDRDPDVKSSSSLSSSSCAYSSQDKSLQGSAAISLSYATLIQCFENISGGHMNPAISLAMFAAGNLSFFRAVLHILFQLSGAIVAVLLFYGVAPGQKDKLADIFPKLHPSLQPWQGFCIEYMQGILLSIAWLSTVSNNGVNGGGGGVGNNNNRRQSGNPSSSALPVGFAMLANSLWANSLTGASVNPARCIAPIIFFRTFDGVLWVYIAGPIFGCISGAVLYQQLFVTIPSTEMMHGLDTSNSSTSGDSECGVRETRPIIRDRAEGKRDDDITSYSKHHRVQEESSSYMSQVDHRQSLRFIPLNMANNNNNQHQQQHHIQQQQQRRSLTSQRLSVVPASACESPHVQHLMQLGGGQPTTMAAAQPKMTHGGGFQSQQAMVHVNTASRGLRMSMTNDPSSQRRMLIHGGENEQLIGNSSL